MKKLLMPILWCCSAVAIAAFSVVFFHQLEVAKAKKVVDHSAQISALEEFAIVMRSYDGDKDWQILPANAKSILLTRPDIDANGDGQISLQDALSIFARMDKAGGKDAEITPEQWSEVSNDLSLFVFLDRSKDKLLTKHDLLVSVSPPTQGLTFKIRDERNGEMLALDEIRLGWMRRINSVTKQGCIIWKNNFQKVDYFGGGKRAKIRHKETKSLDFGFLSEGRNEQEVRILNDKGRVLYVSKAEYDVMPIRDDDSTAWYRATKEIAPNAPERWRDLALKLKGGDLNDEAVWAAKKALIYQPGLSELHELAGVKMHNGSFVATR